MDIFDFVCKNMIKVYFVIDIYFTAICGYSVCYQYILRRLNWTLNCAVSS